MRKTRVQTVIEHLLDLGRITEATANHQYGRFRLADVIHRLRNERKDLVPKGFAILTVNREDRMGQQFAEYRLVPENQAHA